VLRVHSPSGLGGLGSERKVDLPPTEGVLVAKKDFYGVWAYKSKDGDKDVSLPNLEVMGLMKSLKSRGYVKETFNW
jgi:hypothetical protein